MSTIDLVIGVGPERLNTAIAQIFQNQSLRDQLFSGAQNGEFEGVKYSVSYKLNAPPTIELRPPSPQEWNNSIKADGAVAPPVENAFFVNLPAVTGSFSSNDTPNQANFAVRAVCNVGHNGNQLLLTAYSVILDLSAMNPLNKFITTSFLIPRILQGVNQMLTGVSIPVPSLPGVALTPPSAVIQNNTLAIGYNLASQGQPGFVNFPLPSSGFFVLASQALTQAAVNYVVTQHIQGQSFHKSGSKGAAGFSAEYNVSGRVNGMHVQTTGDPSKLQATMDLALAASADISLPIGSILKGGEAVIDKIKKEAGKVMHKLDPFNW